MVGWLLPVRSVARGGGKVDLMLCHSRSRAVRRRAFALAWALPRFGHSSTPSASRKRSLSRRYRLRTRMGMQPVVEHPVPGSARRATSPPRSMDATAPAANVHSSATVTPAAMNAKSNGYGPPYVPRPKPQQRWVQSCCSIAKLERALSNPDCTAIETDIMMGWMLEPEQQDLGKGSSSSGGGGGGGSTTRSCDGGWLGGGELDADNLSSRRRAPVCAPYVSAARQGAELPSHVDLTCRFLDRCLNEGCTWLASELDGLNRASTSRQSGTSSTPTACLAQCRRASGPNARQVGSCRVPAYRFCPSAASCARMHTCHSAGGAGRSGRRSTLRTTFTRCSASSGAPHPGSMVVFASALRLAERCVRLQGELLSAVPDSQLLLWTGTGELPIAASTQARIHLELARMGHAERVGFDVQIARSCSEIAGAGAIDCTFFWSRFCRTSVCCCCASHGFPCPSPLPLFRGALELGSNGAASLREGRGASYGERQPLVIERSHGGGMTPNTMGAHSATPGSSPNGRTLSLGSETPSVAIPSPTPPGGGIKLEVANATHGGGEDVSLRF